MDKNCGLMCFRPQWLQKYANFKWFMIIYGLLGTFQATGYMYFVVTLTTIEKRFKIPSQTTGIILSGNEISQIMLSMILSYAGGQRNRPRWIAWGTVFCSLSCFILAAPHFIFGAGDELLQLTQEYSGDSISLTNLTFHSNDKNTKKLCLNNAFQTEDECNEVFSYLPLILVFLSQFVLGIGNTLYYALGQAYLDDNIRQKSSPLMLGYAMSLRMFGPVIGFILGYYSLNIYIDPSKTPMITKKDSRWLGAWWLGWIVLGAIMFLFAFLVGMFPKHLPKRKKAPTNNELMFEEETKEFIKKEGEEKQQEDLSDNCDLKNFPIALMRLLKNKLLIYNLISSVFYILGSNGYLTYLTRYMEVQFNKSASDATIFTGPITIVAISFGLLLSGYIISKYKPSPRKLFFWNVVVGICYLIGQLAYMELTCDVPSSLAVNNTWLTPSACSSDCNCNSLPYTPVCHTPTQKTFFSPCHAGCKSFNETTKTFANCSCAIDYNNEFSNLAEEIFDDSVSSGVCIVNCETAFWAFTIISMVINFLGSTGRIGNILLNFRAVEYRDKAFSQGLALTVISLFALIPGPVIFGRIIDNTCVIWGQKCGERGDCQLYDKDLFRYYLNITSFAFTAIGVLFDLLVWYYGKNLVLYGDDIKHNAKDIKTEQLQENINSTSS